MSVSVGTYNILHGLNYPKWLEGTEEINLTLVSDAIRQMKLDICGLNEVRNQEQVPGLCNQAKVIAENLGYNYVFAKAINYRGGEYGNALVTRYPILSYKTIPIVVPQDKRIAGQAYEDRVLLSADLLVDGKVLTVMVSHFGLSADEQSMAIEVVRETVCHCQTPLALMGDFNFTSATAYYDALCRFVEDTVDLVEGSEFTFPSPAPNQKIDYLFVNQRCKAVSTEIPAILSSDHRPYKVVLDIL